MKFADSKYYRELMRDANAFKLDFDEEPWFDSWHTHVDWEGRGNKNSEERHIHLTALFIVFGRVFKQASEKFVEFQCWCDVGPDSAQDAVYLHTKNPNQDNFPLDFSAIEWDCNVPQMLAPHLDKKCHRLGLWEHDRENFYTIIFKAASK